MLEIKNLHVSVEGKEIIKGIDLAVKKGEVHALMGPNGSGKSTLAHALMGHPKYQITKGEILFSGKNMLPLSPDKRAKLGLFLAFQYPQEIEGLNLSQFLFTIVRSKNPEEKRAFKVMQEFKENLEQNLSFLGLEKSFADRYLNYGFSGGEKKRAEVLQMLMLKPEIAILDETDSGLDIDSIQVVSKAINTMRGNFGALVITHYQRILQCIEPDFVHVMINGKIKKSGGHELAHELEKKGYNWLMTNGV